ncbi:hypothetical protein ACFPRL_16515 [Pseudoclavibacter helvolus]
MRNPGPRTSHLAPCSCSEPGSYRRSSRSCCRRHSRPARRWRAGRRRTPAEPEVQQGRRSAVLGSVARGRSGRVRPRRLLDRS